MGWTSGSRLFNAVIYTIHNKVSDSEIREEIYEELIDSFTDFDWDTQDECLGEDPAYDRVYKRLFGRSDNEDEDYGDEE